MRTIFYQRWSDGEEIFLPDKWGDGDGAMERICEPIFEAKSKYFTSKYIEIEISQSCKSISSIWR